MMTLHCADLEIALHAYDEDRYRVELRFTQPDSDAEVRPKRDRPLLAQFDLAQLRRLQLDARAYGTTLTAQFFADPALQSNFMQFYHAAQALDVPLQVRLFIGPSAQELHALHWETLHNPENGTSLLTDENILFSRFLSSEDWHPVKPKARGAVRALVAVANPLNLDEYPNLTPIDVDAEMARITASLDDLPVQTLTSPGKASLDNIVAELRESYDFLYLVAHGIVRNGQPYLWLEKQDGTADIVSGNAFVTRIQQLAQRPRLVVLVSCQSARVEDTGALTALGPRLAQAGIPAVLAMQGDVSAVTMEQFLPAFFEELRKDGQIDRALTVARSAIKKQPDWWMPTLFLRLKSGRLWSEDVIWGRGGNPYRGLQVFEREHADLYFGREAAIHELLEALSHRDFVALVGVSGSGKSSLVRAGLEKGLRAHAIPGLVERSRCLTVPGRNPMLNLVLSLADTEGVLTSDLIEALKLPEDALAEEKRSQTAEILNARPPQTLGEALRACVPSEGVLLIVDQFERLYTECDDEEVHQHFIDTLLAAAGDKVKVLLALRADYYGLVLEHPGLERVVKQDGQVTLGRMTEADLRAAIEQPAQAMGRSLEPGLTERLIADVHERAGDLPLLEFALTELWERDSQTGVLTLQTYDALGYEASDGRKFPGVRGAIAQRAEVLWQNLDEQERRAARRVFLNLVTPGPLDERGERLAEDASRRAWQVEWDETTRCVVRKLVDARLLTTGQDPASDQPTVEVAHEALIRAWPRLQRWLEDYRPFVRWYNTELAPFLRRWLDKEQQPDLLLPEAMLPQAQHWLDRYPEELTGPPAGYIRTSVERHERERAAEERRRRRLTMASVGAAVVFLLLALLAWGQRNAAQEAQATAVAEAHERATAQAQAEYSQATAVAETEVRATAQAQAEARRVEAEASQQEARYQARISRAQELAARAQATHDPTGSLNLMLAREAALITWLTDTDVITRPFVTNETLAALNSAINSAGKPSLHMMFPRSTGHTGTVDVIAYSPDGTRIVSGSWDETVRVWDATTGEELLRLIGHTGPIKEVAYSPDGTRIVSGSWDETVRVWDATTGEELLRLSVAANSVDYSPDGLWIVTGRSNILQVWDAFTGEMIQQWDAISDDLLKRWAGSAYWVNAVAYSPDGTRVVSGLGGSLERKAHIQVWDAVSGEEILELTGHTDGVTSVAYSPDGTRIVSGAMDNTIRVWDATTGEELLQLIAHTQGRIKALSYSPDGTRILSGGGNSVQVWDAESGKELLELHDYYYSSVDAVAWSPDGMRIVSGGLKTVLVWDAVSGEVLLQIGGDTSKVWAVAYSPDGTRILSGGSDGKVRVWKAENGDTLQQLIGHTGAVWAVAYSPDGTRIVSGSVDKTVRVWDAVSGEELLQLSAHTGSIVTVACSPDGTRVVSGSEDKTIRVWDAVSGEELLQLTGHTDGVTSVAYSPDGTRIVSGSLDETVRIWDAASGQELLQMTHHIDGVTAVAYSPDGTRIVSGSGAWGSTVLVWDAESGEVLLRLDDHTHVVTAVAYSPDGKQIVSGIQDGYIRVWDAESGEKLLELGDYSGWATAAAYSPDGMRIVSASYDGELRVWNVAGQETRQSFLGHTGEVWAVAYNPDGTRIVSGSRDGTIRVWDAMGRKKFLELIADTAVTAVAYSPDGTKIVSGGVDEIVKVWDAISGEVLLQLGGYTGWVTTVAYSPDGTRIASGSHGNTIQVWNAESGEELLQLRSHPGPVMAVAYSPDGRRIVSGCENYTLEGNTVQVWDSETGELLLQLSGYTGDVNALTYSPDGTRIVIGGKSKSVRVYDATSGEELLQLLGHTDHVNTVAYSPDGTQIASGSDDGTVRIWNAFSGEELWQLTGHTAKVWAVAYSPDGTRIASSNRGIRWWYIDVPYLLDLADSLIQRDPPIFVGQERALFGFDVWPARAH